MGGTRAAVRNGLEKDFPFHRIKGVAEVQLEQNVVWGCLLQPHANAVHQAFGPTRYSHPHLFRCQATCCLRLVPGNEELPGQPPEGFPNGDGPHTPTLFSQRDQAGPRQRREARRGESSPGEVTADPG